MTAPQNLWVKKTLKEMREALGGCQAPGCTTTAPHSLEFAHVKPTKLMGRERGRINRLEDVRRNPDCYTILCDDGGGDHHQEFDDANKQGLPIFTPKTLLEIAIDRGLCEKYGWTP